MRAAGLLATLALLLAACGAGGAAVDQPTTTTTSAAAPTTVGSTTTTTLPPTTTRPSTTTTTQGTTTQGTTTTQPTTATTTPSGPFDLEVTRGLTVPGGIPMDVFAPTTPGPWPAIVLFHGGGWISGEKEDLEPLARRIAGQGTVVYNAGYEAIRAATFFPQTFDQVTCAIRAAGVDLAGRGAVADGIVVAGYSAGAHLAALSVFSDGVFHDGCADVAAPVVVGFAGISGPYDSDLYPQLLLNFGASRDDDPELWSAGNPITYLADHDPLPSLLLHGGQDLVVAPVLSTWFAEDLAAAGHPVDTVVFPDLDHFEVVALAGAETATRIHDFAAGLLAP